ncbi:MAG TPA: Dyp-type peroxidase, partial [Candidatus Binatus sp.]|nr:Dyp-type peroxidase [Candidatus Binatus sp.]
DGDTVVVGIGQPTVIAVNKRIDGLRTFPTHFDSGLVFPSSSAALWCWLRGSDRGALLHQSRKLVDAVGVSFSSDSIIDAFKHDDGRDLTGYVDGTENPKGAKASSAAIVRGQGAGLDGASFVAVQQWAHDFARFESMAVKDRDNAIGRRKSDNKELFNAPASAHVKRTAQESFSPEAFVVRRSMPWADGTRGGLNFVAFGKSFDAFEAQLKRMVGAEDGITDALFKFTTPVSGSYFWCPPMRNGKLDLRALGL